ncbi:MAG: hypothetical protein H7234_07755 [Herminiimonas sp.]|nr:hypothetical protein [Herminiimonas sp.]
MTFIAAGICVLGTTGMAQARPVLLSDAQMDGVTAGLTVPRLSLGDFNSTGATAFATSTAVSTPFGTAIVNASITTSIGLKTVGFTDSITFTVLR